MDRRVKKQNLVEIKAVQSPRSAPPSAGLTSSCGLITFRACRVPRPDRNLPPGQGTCRAHKTAKVNFCTPKKKLSNEVLGVHQLADASLLFQKQENRTPLMAGCIPKET